MLLPHDIHPRNSIYYNGAYVLRALQQADGGVLKLLDLFDQTRELLLKSPSSPKPYRPMSYSVFLLSLDWLYLARIVDCDDQGKVLLCS